MGWFATITKNAASVSKVAGKAAKSLAKTAKYATNKRGLVKATSKLAKTATGKSVARSSLNDMRNYIDKSIRVLDDNLKIQLEKLNNANWLNSAEKESMRKNIIDDYNVSKHNLSQLKQYEYRGTNMSTQGISPMQDFVKRSNDVLKNIQLQPAHLGDLRDAIFKDNPRLVQDYVNPATSNSVIETGVRELGEALSNKATRNATLDIIEKLGELYPKTSLRRLAKQARNMTQAPLALKQQIIRDVLVGLNTLEATAMSGAAALEAINKDGVVSKLVNEANQAYDNAPGVSGIVGGTWD